MIMQVKKVLIIFKYILIFMSVLILMLLISPYLLSVGGREIPDNFQPFPESRFSEVDGIKLHYRLFETEANLRKGNILLVHGFSGSTFSWRKNAEILADHGFRVVAVDLPAYGFSDKTSVFNHSSTARSILLWSFLSGLSDESWSLAGHSMGASVVIAMAASNPYNTNNLILVDGAYFGSTSSDKQGALMNMLRFPPVQRWAEVIASKRYLKYEQFQKILSTAYGTEADSAAVAGYLEPFLYRNSASAVLNSFLNSREIFPVKIEDIQTRTLIIWGEKDTWVPLNSGEQINKRLANSELIIIQDSGHCPMETHAEEFNKLLLQFLIKE